MNTSLFLVGLSKAAFGIIVGAVGIFIAARALHRLIGSGSTDEHTREGNLAIGVLKAGSLIALGILCQHSVTATFAAMDLMYSGQSLTLGAVGSLALYALLHLGVSIIVSATVLALGSWLFASLTRDVDEMKEIRAGNVAPALVLAAVMVVLALLTAPGLQTTLDGLLPIPELARDQVAAPA